jgi:hypothetical protein
MARRWGEVGAWEVRAGGAQGRVVAGSGERCRCGGQWTVDPEGGARHTTR